MDDLTVTMGALYQSGQARNLIEAYRAGEHLSTVELALLAESAVDDYDPHELRDRLDLAANRPEDEFARHGCTDEEITAARAWAQEWADQLGLDLAEEQPWTDES
ncbi:hypothetical protein ABGB17_14900 [Sphaerisporangium sp. B11E5]|uniref:hypothetical protein n=1 Tax=Sphaerisporangium sp. B11E5 TaxID=3153563 RepID=UPI00325DC510